jgi:uncharacterized protein (TIGR04255 family)
VTLPWYDYATLPKFDHPPVVEAAIAVEFAPLTGLNNAALNRLQKAWTEKFPDLEDRPGTPPTPLHSDGEILFNVTGPDSPRRIWAAGRGNGLLVQTQNDRLILNWRKQFSRGPYVGFDALKSEFSILWEQMGDFVDGEGLLSRSPTLAEYTYVNAVPIEPGESFNQVVLLLGGSGNDVPGSESFTRFQFIRDVAIADGHPFNGQIFIQGEPQLYASSRHLVFTVTARVLVGGRPEGPLEGVVAAHALASHTFASIITPEKKAVWGHQS